MPALANATLLLWSTWTPVEDLPYPEDDDRGIIDAHKDQHAEVDFGAGTYGSMTSHKLGERDDAGWFTYDSVGPTVGAKHDTYEPEPYTILIWPAPYLYTHPAEYHGVKDPAEAFYYFNLRSDLDETSSNVSSRTMTGARSPRSSPTSKRVWSRSWCPCTAGTTRSSRSQA